MTSLRVINQLGDPLLSKKIDALQRIYQPLLKAAE